MFRVVISERAEQDMQSAFNWWAEHRSMQEASRWFDGFTEAIADLAQNRQRHGRSKEQDQFAFEIRDLLFGLGRRPTHRAVFLLRDDEVVVLTVRHVAQRDLSPDDVIIEPPR